MPIIVPINILALPLEVLQGITAQITDADRKSLRLSCSQLKDAAEPQLFSTFKIIIADSRKSSRDGLQILEAWTTGNRICGLIRELDFRFGGPYTRSERLHASDAFGRVKACLIEALSSLTRLEKLFVRWHENSDFISARNAFFAGLSALSNLEQLSVEVTGDWTSSVEALFPAFPLQFLQHISITAPMPSESSWDPVFALIGQSANLRGLSLRVLLPYTSPFSASPSRLDLTKVPSPPQLSMLSIGGVQVKHGLGEYCQARLTSLVSLCIHDKIEDAFWTALASEKVFPKTLFVLIPTPSMIRYLSQHSGLETLGITATVDSSPDLNQLFEVALPHHNNTLQRIRFGCSLNDEQLDTISKCTHLTSLEVTFDDDIAELEVLERTTSLMKTINALPSLINVNIDFYLTSSYCFGATPVSYYRIISQGVREYEPVNHMDLNPSLSITVESSPWTPQLSFLLRRDTGKFDWSSPPPKLDYRHMAC